jgi:plastocyanin
MLLSQTMRTRDKKAVVLAALAVVAVMALAAACGSAGATTTGSPAPAATAGPNGAVVTISNFAFLPQKIEIRPGTTVTWTNNDPVTHTVTSTDSLGIDAQATFTFRSDTLSQGQTFSFTFDKAGTYFYECTIHKSLRAMHGEIVVGAGASGKGSPAGSGGTSPSPAPTPTPAGSTSSGGPIPGY